MGAGSGCEERAAEATILRRSIQGHGGHAVFSADHELPVSDMHRAAARGEDAASLPLAAAGVGRREEPWQERSGAARRPREGVTPWLADGVEADVFGGCVEAARDLTEQIGREVEGQLEDAASAVAVAMIRSDVIESRP